MSLKIKFPLKSVLHIRSQKNWGNKQNELLNTSVNYLVAIMSKPNKFKRKVDDSTCYTADLRDVAQLIFVTSHS